MELFSIRIQRTFQLVSTVKFEYFYQCMAHMMCTGAQWTDFVIYNPFQSNPIHIVRILPDEAVFAEMEKRIRVADDIVKELIEAE